MTPMKAIQIDSLSQIDRDQWNSLAGPNYPFLRHEFLSALERRSTSPETGWQPRHLLIYEQNEPIALMPLYLKFHSRGEYVFDYQWVEAYHNHHLAYYPKLLTAIPFTPCQGPRIAIKTGADQRHIASFIASYIKETIADTGASSWHCLFPDSLTAEKLVSEGLSLRTGIQFQWFNKGYRDFNDYLDGFSAGKRKQVKRERRRIAEQSVQFRQISGKDISEQEWEAFYRFYQMTYFKRGMQPYLNIGFFLEIAETMPQNLLLIVAVKDGDYIGAALSFIGNDTLYGRYWGCNEEYHSLHFEACYYQGLDYCLANNLKRFDSGAQGEHKIARGFEPVYTYSAHWIKDRRFAAAIDDFLEWETAEIQKYRLQAEKHLPFKRQT